LANFCRSCILDLVCDSLWPELFALNLIVIEDIQDGGLRHSSKNAAQPKGITDEQEPINFFVSNYMNPLR
jgi:hypothetical protein